MCVSCVCICVCVCVCVVKIMLPVGMKDDGSVHYSMLGLGDIIVPAFLAIYVCRNAVGNYLVRYGCPLTDTSAHVCLAISLSVCVCVCGQPPLRAPLVCFFVGYVAGLASASIAVSNSLRR